MRLPSLFMRSMHGFGGALGFALGLALAGCNQVLGITDHEQMLERFAFAAVAKCYPGRLPGGRGDRAPDRGVRERCLPWTDALVRLCDPTVVERAVAQLRDTLL